MTQISETEEEKVMVVSKDEIAKFIDLKEGLNTEITSEQLNRLTDWNRAEFKPRSQVEEDESYYQLIPYVVVVKGDKVFLYQRTKKSGEQRLEGKFSVGIGGHINSHDAGFMSGINREIKEEMYIPVGYLCYDFVGLIVDSSNPVGRVHLGLVYTASTGDENLPILAIPCDEKQDVSILPHGFISLAELREDKLGYKKDFEEWSRICLDNIIIKQKIG